MTKRIIIFGSLLVLAFLVGHFWRASDGLPASAVAQAPNNELPATPPNEFLLALGALASLRTIKSVRANLC